MGISTRQKRNRRKVQAVVLSDFYKENENDRIWWVDDMDATGLWLFSFDKKKIYNMFADFPQKLTKEEVRIFIEENPYWADFFRDRLADYL